MLYAVYPLCSVIFAECYLDDQTKKNGMGGVCSMCGV